MTTTTETKADLEEQRQVLAYEASIGTPGAAKQLEAIERQLGAIGRDAERAELAGKEAARRAALEAEQRAAAKRMELEAALEVELGKRPALCEAAEAQMAALLVTLAKLDAVSRAAYRITSDLNAPRSRLIVGERIGVWIQHRLSEKIDMPRPPRELRQSLADLIGAK